MFTGIIEELGEVVDVAHGADSARIAVRGPRVTDGARPGDSIAVNGVCLTVTAADAGRTVGPGVFVADVMAQTLDLTGLGGLVPGAPVNLERPVALADRLGGHIVQGHVDGVGTVLERVPGDRCEVVRIGCPPGLIRYLVDQGSVAVDGVSLTVVSVHDEGPSFTVSLIPQTLAETTLGRRAVGEPVNLEVDVLAKYVERLLGPRVGRAG